ncbi:MAG: ComEC/Rec2 family competence protein [Acidobacteria bacterium]|nr:MAG: ComEC/Rec2 family competence protein [Acidobacteriota bacterium]
MEERAGPVRTKWLEQRWRLGAPAFASACGGVGGTLLAANGCPPETAAWIGLLAAGMLLYGCGGDQASGWRRPLAGVLFGLGGAGALAGALVGEEQRRGPQPRGVVEAIVELSEPPTAGPWSLEAAAIVVAHRRRPAGWVPGGEAVRLRVPLGLAAVADAQRGDRFRVRGSIERRTAPANGLGADDEPLRGRAGASGLALAVKSERLLRPVPGRSDERVLTGLATRPARRAGAALRRRLLAELRHGPATAETEDRPPGGRLAAALWLGDQRLLPAPFARTVRGAGLGHLFAASGLHVGIVALAAGAAWGGRSGGLARGLVVLSAVWVYALAAGLGASVVRAALAVTCWLAAVAAQRRPAALQVFGLTLVAALASGAWRAQALGLSLSFTAVFGIWCGLTLRRSWQGRGAAGGRSVLAGEAMTVVAWAQWATFPLVVGAFGRWSLLSWAGNLLAAPLVAALLPLSLLLACVGSSAPAAWPLLGVLEALVQALVLVAAAADRASVVAPPFAAAVWWAGSALALSSAVALARRRSGRDPRRHPTRRERRPTALTPGTVLALLLAWTALPGAVVSAALVATSARRALEAGLQSVTGAASATVQALDVGQGDATLLTSGLGAVLIDGGGWSPASTSSVAQQVLEPVLRRHGVGRLAAAIVTHDDTDHCLGIVELASRLRIEELWVSGDLGRRLRSPSAPASPMAGGGRCEEGLRRGFDGRIRVLAEGERRSAAGWRFEVLGGGAAAGSRGNQDSLVVRARWRRRCVLVTGDLDRRGELALLGRTGDLSCDVLQVGHHGSATSSDPRFLAAVRPRWALVSAGRRNRYGHPHPRVLRDLCATGALVLRTDLDGRLVLRFDAAGRSSFGSHRDRLGEGAWRPCHLPVGGGSRPLAPSLPTEPIEPIEPSESIDATGASEAREKRASR